ncbi:MAG: hypothetical protein IPM29_29845 [Planctomycetes bacterium]|nr:hypothetical protein [Planctomycetota bacterium]
MIRSTTPTVLASLVLALFPVSTAFAQDPASAPATPARARPTEPTASFRFEGGSLQEFVAILRSNWAPGQTPNVIVPLSAVDVELPAIELRDVTVGTALQAIASCAYPRWQVRYERVATEAGQTIHTLMVMPGPTQSQTVVQGSGRDPRDEVMTVVFSLRELIEAPPGVDASLAIPAATVLTAIEAGLELDGGLAEAKLGFHESSSLLFVRGNRDRLRLVEQTIDALKSDLRDRRNRTAHPTVTGPSGTPTTRSR